MAQLSSIRDFVDRRWSDAKEKLLELDPEFVRRVETLDRISKLSFELPGTTELPTPSRRLSKDWQNLLAATFDVVHELDNLQTTLSLLCSNTSPGTRGRLAAYYYDVWVQQVFNLCDKVNRFVTLYCKLYCLRRGKDNRERTTNAYRNKIKGRVQRDIELLRSPLVHGAGGKGTLAERVISEEYQGWEINVVAGSRGERGPDRGVEAGYLVAAAN